MSTYLQMAPIGNEVISVGGVALTVRPVEITDVDRLMRMFGRLSRESVYFRFFSPIRRIPSSALLRLADVDHDRREALVALDGDEIVAVVRYDGMREPDRSPIPEAEIAVTVEDAWHRRGLGLALLRRLAVIARDRGYHTFTARMLPDNRAALALIRKLAPDATLTFAGEYEARMSLAGMPLAGLSPVGSSPAGSAPGSRAGRARGRHHPRTPEHDREVLTPVA